MNKRDYLLVCLAEECSEVIKTITKIMRFGENISYPKGAISNREKLQDELNDIFGVVALLQDNKIINEKTLQGKKVQEKKNKVIKHFEEQDNTLEKDIINMFERSSF